MAVNPLLAVVIGSWIVLKGGNYAITRPAREMLYTLVNREDRFKAKPVIDIVVYRGGDTLAGWMFTGLTAGLGLGIAGVAVVGARRWQRYGPWSACISVAIRSRRAALAAADEPGACH